MRNFLLIPLLALAIFTACENEDPTAPTFTLTVNVTPTEAGKVSISPQADQYNQNTTVTLTPEANEHWVFQQWDGDESGSATPLQITMDTNKSITAVFVRRNYPLTISIEGGGTVEEKIVSMPNGRDLPHGTVIELTPKPEEGWEFDGWGGDLSGNTVPQTLTIDQPTSVLAKFVENKKFFLHENGITCLCPETKPGDKGFINGVLYESVDNQLIRQRRDQGVDMTKLCTTLVTDMSELFAGTLSQLNPFNQPIGNWDVSNVTDMRNMFLFSRFNQPLGNWNVSKVINMVSLFSVSEFNQAIEDWDVSKVENMEFMFYRSSFNQFIGNWNVNKVSNMRSMFGGDEQNLNKFNQIIKDWDVSNVLNMSGMFVHSEFNQAIGDWNVSKVKDMTGMFWNSQFNQPIGNWDVSNVIEMFGMFNKSSFNQNISNWCVINIPSEPQAFSTDSPLTSANKPRWGTCPSDSQTGDLWPVGYVHCNGVPTEVVEVTNPVTGRTWMDRNLGASRVATSSTDQLAFGDLYQWGRGADGHQCRNSGTTTVLSSTDQPGHGDFILKTTSPWDWRSPQNDELWQGVNGINNPCPNGYRLPTSQELEAEYRSWTIDNSQGAFESNLKLPMAGSRVIITGTLVFSGLGTRGDYWGSSFNGSKAKGMSFMNISPAGAGGLTADRNNAFSVRCIKN
ncbi:BspA family leucine-rich repeat surface protein [Mongoliitalea lutea]|uniref:Bacterial repeat domain-containing protein n=1 Tax=Mongoliitalea lutea TaxID=849756 RepID=A0A8J3G4A8_9BACT|nr:BspA family leucine-rich repeat surface protein [Mongoliitalea lutea]GHB29439.1 hypothetical protein GCM10008106_07980 [Mongoliitalea lutea]